MRGVTGTLGDDARLIVLADSDGNTLSDPDGIDLETGLCWLTSAKWQLGSSFCTWDSSPLVSGLLRCVMPSQRIDVAASLSTAFGQWRLLWIPGKFLEIRRLRKLWRLYDVSGLFPRGSTLVGTLHKWGMSTPADRSQLPLFDRSQVKGWSGLTLESIISACARKARGVSQLMRQVVPALDRIDLTPARWHGVGSIGARILKDSGGRSWISKYAPDRQPTCEGVPLLPVFLAASYGGRTETTVAGTWQVPTYRYDLRSAYAWALSHIGPVGFEWERRAVFSHDIADRMSVWYVEWELPPDSPLGPFPYRHGLGHPSIGYPLSGRGWYWWPEVRAALRAYPDRVRVHHGYLSPRSTRRPLRREIRRRYKQRLELERARDPAADLLKTGLASVYGRLAQRESAGGMPGRVYNPALSGWVTSAIRARIIDAYAGQEADIVAVATDSVLSIRPLAISPSADLGGWRLDTWADVTYVLPGLYRLRQETPHYTREEVATAGVTTLDFDWLLSELTLVGRAQISQQWFVPHLLADLFPDRWGNKRCQWIETPVTINPYRLSMKRQNADGLLGMDWANDYHDMAAHPSLGLLDSLPSEPPPAWVGKTDPYALAVANLNRSR